MTDEERDVRPRARGFDRGALRGEIGPSAAVGIRDEGRHALGEQRLCLVERGTPDPFRRMGVDVDESRRDETIARIDRARCDRVSQATDGNDAIRGNAEVCTTPRVGCAIRDASVANQNVEMRLLCRLNRSSDGGNTQECEGFPHGVIVVTQAQLVQPVTGDLAEVGNRMSEEEAACPKLRKP